jgi:uncharacterized protein involved in exopolysaccharide biosynthesis
MEHLGSAQPAGDGFTIGKFFSELRPVLWKIVVLTISVGIVTLAWMLRKPDLYRASAIITPSVEESKQAPALGALAYIGVSVGGPSKVEDLESLFKSNDLALRVFQRHNPWPILKPKSFDPKTGRFKPGWADRFFGKNTDGRTPSDWDSIRAIQTGLAVQVNRRNGTLSLSFESPSGEGSASIVRYYLEEAKSRLQEEALERAGRNKKFIEEQIGKTVDALTRDRLYSLYGQEVEREMMARNRDQFGFKIIDSPRAPDISHKPDRIQAVLASIFASFPLWCIYYSYRIRRKTSTR